MLPTCCHGEPGTRQMPFLSPNQQHQSTEYNYRQVTQFPTGNTIIVVMHKLTQDEF